MRSLIPWNTMATLSPISSEFERMLGRMQQGEPRGLAANHNLIRLDWSESDDEVLVRAELPGVAAEDLEITVAGDLLTLVGEKKSVVEESEGKTSYSERHYGKFQRQVKLPFTVATDGVRAESKDGVVTIHLPKAEAERSRRISIDVAS